jgi:uncharacterized protein (DUF1499 family)
MARQRKIMTAAIGILVGTAVFFLGVRLWMGRAAEDKAAPDEIVDFATIDPAGRQNLFLMCPPGLCAKTDAEASPSFAMPWQRLRDHWEEAVRQQPRTALVWMDPDRRKLVYVQRSAALHFPDIVTVEFLPAVDGGSTLAVASQSRYGRRDFGVNRDRVIAWTDRLVGLMKREEVTTTR